MLCEYLPTKYETVRRSAARRGRMHNRQPITLRSQRKKTIISFNRRAQSQIEYPCRNCGKMYKHRGNLSRHMKYECGKDALFSCQTCGRKFSQNCNLTRHISSQHAEIKKRHCNAD